jgi:hypothetical protein
MLDRKSSGFLKLVVLIIAYGPSYLPSFMALIRWYGKFVLGRTREENL